MEKNVTGSFSRPILLGQRVQWDHPPRPAEVVLLQGQLLYVQEDVRAEEEGDAQRVREAGEEAEGYEGSRAVEETGGMGSILYLPMDSLTKVQ